MGGGGIAMFDVDKDFEYMGVTFTQYHNIRHLVISGDDLLISTNSNGYIQKEPWRKFVDHRIENAGRVSTMNEGWQIAMLVPVFEQSQYRPTASTSSLA